VVTAAGHPVTLQRPRFFQDLELEGAYVLLGDHEVGFRVADYDPARALVIDPVLVYSTYLGGNQDDAVNAVAVDGSGNVYVTGTTSSPNFPTANAVQPAPG